MMQNWTGEKPAVRIHWESLQFSCAELCWINMHYLSDFSFPQKTTIVIMK